MGLQIRKRIKLTKNIHLNVSKSGVSLNIGKQGRNITVSKKGIILNAGINGSGVSYRKEIISFGRKKK